MTDSGKLIEQKKKKKDESRDNQVQTPLAFTLLYNKVDRYLSRLKNRQQKKDPNTDDRQDHLMNTKVLELSVAV